MFIRAIYSDWSEWAGSVDDWPSSPATSAEDVGLSCYKLFLDDIRAMTLEGYDYYGLRADADSVHIASWAEYLPDCHIYRIDRDSLGQFFSLVPRAQHPTDLVLRYGKYMSDAEFEKQQAYVRTWRYGD